MGVAASHFDALRAALDQPPQTNEVGRSAALIGGLLRINREFDLPVRLFEIGSSAGLNLRADHYRYRFADSQWGPVDSPVTIDDAWHGVLPPEGGVRIVERHGYDIAPIDVTGADGEMTVLSYVWPDQDARLERLRGAIEVARSVPARLERQTAADAVAGLTLADGALTVLWHSITWQYLSAEERDAVRARVDALAERADRRLAVRPPHDGTRARRAWHTDQVFGASSQLAGWRARSSGRMPSARPSGELAVATIAEKFVAATPGMYWAGLAIPCRIRSPTPNCQPVFR